MQTPLAEAQALTGEFPKPHADRLVASAFGLLTIGLRGKPEQRTGARLRIALLFVAQFTALLLAPWISAFENKHNAPSTSRNKQAERIMRKRKTSCVPLQRSTASWQKNSKIAGCSKAVSFPWALPIFPAAIDQ